MFRRRAVYANSCYCTIRSERKDELEQLDIERACIPLARFLDIDEIAHVIVAGVYGNSTAGPFDRLLKRKIQTRIEIINQAILKCSVVELCTRIAVIVQSDRNAKTSWNSWI